MSTETTGQIVSLTPGAVTKIKELTQSDPAAQGKALRIYLEAGGCSGYQYVVESASAIGEDDATFECKGVQIVVDKLSLRYLAGTELDYVREGLNEGFRFNNPNVAETCGCGESFSVADTGA